ncbi:translation initiation factor eIF-2B subunit family protein [Xylariomycetidae sp. FL0641]|nr:translation initiation factor eIF-2B subunit family protein [Xylariomycetidae sp. FL0641]
MSSASKNEAPAGEPTKRAVAGSFLFKIPEGDEKNAKVALFRRSAKVRTYPHKLAPLSGSVEDSDASPMATALREIQEETRLTSDSVELLRVGKPYSFIDHSVGREWTINPFGFRLKDKTEGGQGEEGIQLDWEHDSIEWYDPLDVKDTEEFGRVPKLVNSLRRVWPEYDLGARAGAALTDGLQKLRNDHESGARQLATVAVSTLKDVVALMDHAKMDETWWASVRMAAWHICQARESMGAAITSAIVKALDAIEAEMSSEVSEKEDGKAERIIRSIDRQITARNTATDRISHSFANWVRTKFSHLWQQSTPNQDGSVSPKTLRVLTLSSSSTVSYALRQAASTLGLSLDLRILESRPLCEGVTMASQLLSATDESAAITIHLYSDASAAIAAKGTDLVIIGADRISASGDVSNKVGSLPAILSARHTGCPVVVLSETEKIAPSGHVEPKAEENDPSEMTEKWQGVPGIQAVESELQKPSQSRLAVRNVYFEWVPSEMITITATEEGLLKTKQIKKYSEKIATEMDRFFKDL